MSHQWSRLVSFASFQTAHLSALAALHRDPCADPERSRNAALEGSLRIFVPVLLERTASLYRRERDSGFASTLKGAANLFADLRRYQETLATAGVVDIRSKPYFYRDALGAVAGALEYLKAEEEDAHDSERRRRTFNGLVSAAAGLDLALNPVF